MNRKITLKYIAKELNVSISTVSKALKDSYEISEETKSKIQAFAKAHNYKPNNIALSLKNKKTSTIAIIIPEIVHNFFSTVISGIEEEANKRGYNVIIGVSNESFEKEVINMEMLANGSIDGFILSLSKGTLKSRDYHHIQEVINQGMPVVMLDRITNDILCDKVIIDDHDSAKMAVNYLVSTGCKKIGLITTEDHISVGVNRTKGYFDALKENGFEIILSNIVKIGRQENIEQDIEKFFSRCNVDAILCVNEIYAVTAMKIAMNKGFKIPTDISVIGYTDGILSRYSNPSLTTIGQQPKEMGKHAVNMLIKAVEGDGRLKESFETKVLLSHLITRESTKPITS